MTLEPALRRGYDLLNRWFMVPLHRLGLGAWIATPVGGYMLLLEVRGRRTGKARYVPLSYVIADGAIWLLAGYGIAVDPLGNAYVTGVTASSEAAAKFPSGIGGQDLGTKTHGLGAAGLDSHLKPGIFFPASLPSLSG